MIPLASPHLTSNIIQLGVKTQRLSAVSVGVFHHSFSTDLSPRGWRWCPWVSQFSSHSQLSFEWPYMATQFTKVSISYIYGLSGSTERFGDTLRELILLRTTRISELLPSPKCCLQHLVGAHLSGKLFVKTVDPKLSTLKTGCFLWDSGNKKPLVTSTSSFSKSSKSYATHLLHPNRHPKSCWHHSWVAAPFANWPICAGSIGLAGFATGSWRG
jgi:hypothetical protein